MNSTTFVNHNWPEANHWARFAAEKLTDGLSEQLSLGIGYKNESWTREPLGHVAYSFQCMNIPALCCVGKYG